MECLNTANFMRLAIVLATASYYGKGAVGTPQHHSDCQVTDWASGINEYTGPGRAIRPESGRLIDNKERAFTNLADYEVVEKYVHAPVCCASHHTPLVRVQRPIQSCRGHHHAAWPKLASPAARLLRAAVLQDNHWLIGQEVRGVLIWGAPDDALSLDFSG